MIQKYINELKVNGIRINLSNGFIGILINY